MKISRRQFGLRGLGAALSAFVLGAGSAAKRRFLFVHAEGGWDPLCAFAPMFSAPLINMEGDTAPLTIGNFNLVDSPGRPAVKQFFERWGDQTLLLNGLSTRSVNHETCQAVALTGSTSDSGSDWATLLAAAQQQQYYLPHVVFRGPSFTGANAVAVSHAQGLLRETVNGSLLGFVDMPFDPPSGAVRSRVDSYLASRGAALAGLHAGSPLAADHHKALTRSHTLTDQAEVINFDPAYSLAGDAANAIGLLADDVIRCASVSTDFVWDSHENNGDQTPRYQELFTDLDVILDALSKTPSKSGEMLSQDTVGGGGERNGPHPSLQRHRWS